MFARPSSSFISKTSFSKSARLILTVTAILCARAAFADVTVSSPSNGATVTSPVRIVASATSANPITAVRVYVDNVSVLLTVNPIDAYIWMRPGAHFVVVQAWDSTGAVFKSPLNLTVADGPVRDLTGIEKMSGWQWCTKDLNGNVCASGIGEATSWMAPYQTQPSLDGASSQFFVGGMPYSNALWWKTLGGSSDVSHFQFDFWVYLTEPGSPQSLEFDMNQSFGGTRWVFGTQCDFNDSGKWDIWDGGEKVWVSTNLNAVRFTGNSWNHFIWNFERVGNQVHYISLVINDVTYPVDVYKSAESNWQIDEINAAVQLDVDFWGHSYSEWLDQVTVRAW